MRPCCCFRTATPPRLRLPRADGRPRWRWRTVAPDMPGFGYSATPSADHFGYTFDAYADFLQRFTDAVGLEHYAVWLHDYGSQFGFRLALSRPSRSAVCHPKRRHLRRHLRPEVRLPQEAVGQPGTGVAPPDRRARHPRRIRERVPRRTARDVADRVSPDLWTLHWTLMNTPTAGQLIHLLEDQPSTLDWFPRTGLSS